MEIPRSGSRSRRESFKQDLGLPRCFFGLSTVGVPRGVNGRVSFKDLRAEILISSLSLFRVKLIQRPFPLPVEHRRIVVHRLNSRAYCFFEDVDKGVELIRYSLLDSYDVSSSLYLFGSDLEFLYVLK